jgi:hypothetical protein
MERRFDTLFSLVLEHPDFPGAPVPGLSLKPTEHCLSQLGRCGLMFKKDPAGGLVVVEKLVRNGQPPTPVRPICEAIVFSFWVENQNQTLLKTTRPFDGSAPLPQSPWASRFLLCTSNQGAVTPNLPLQSAQLSFVYPSAFSVPVSSGVTKVRVTPRRANAAPYDLWPQPLKAANLIEVRLPDGLYQLEHIGSGHPPEPVVVQSNASARAIGLVEIHVDETFDYNAAAVQYRLQLEAGTDMGLN